MLCYPQIVFKCEISMHRTETPDKVYRHCQVNVTIGGRAKLYLP